MRIQNIAVVASVLLGTTTWLPAQNLTTTTTINENDLRAHVDFLASDLLGGRDSGRAGARIAAQYIAAHFQRLGLQPVVDGWQMSFDLPGSASPGIATLKLGEGAFRGSAAMAVPSFSGTGVVSAPLVFDGDDFNGRIAVLDTDDTGDRSAAAAAIDAGAVGVVFLSTQEVFPRPDDGDMRRMGGPSGMPGMPGMSDDGPNGMSGLSSLDDLPDGIREQVLEQLEAMGLDTDSVSFDMRVGGPDEMPDELPMDSPPGTSMSFSMGTPDMFSSARPGVGAPVVALAVSMQTLLLEAAEDGGDVTLEVERDGDNTCTNVLGMVEGSDPVLKNEYVVIGAHYDHVGQDQHGNIWNGADDNASGTAGLLEIAEALSEMRVKPRRTVLLAAWGAEERGLVGSNAFMRSPPVPADQIAAYINLDMIGRNDPGRIEVLSASAALRDRAFRHAEPHGLKADDGQAFFLNASDTAAFVEAGVPTMFYFSQTHKDYHRPSDDPHLLDADKASRVARAAFGVVVETANADDRPDFKPAGRGGMFGGGLPGRPRGRRLGVFESQQATGAGGFEVAGVVESGVGAAAGIQSGDVIIRVADRAIDNATDLRESLEAQEAGAPFEIEVTRDGASVILTGKFPDES